MTKDTARTFIKEALDSVTTPLTLRVLLQKAQVEMDSDGQIVIYTGIHG